MKLKKLKIAGFKSFATPTSINFDGAVVGVVGPNGCGKSNIVDAFRWVMGEQSSRLRGDKMEDVLFAGTKTRPAHNLAEVSLTFTNVRESLQLPFDELTLTRRATRDGESEYFVNGKSVRLKEVQLLFSGVGMGKNALTIFEQGKLDQIIYLQPQERRKLFDEAAGIGRFLLRKKETQQKLQEVDQDAFRLKDIHGEAAKRVEQLQKQATWAEKNLKWQAEHTLLQKAYHVGCLRKIDKEYQDLLIDLKEVEKTIEEREEEEKAKKECCVQMQQHWESKQQEYGELQKQVWQREAQLKVDEGHLREKKEQKERLISNIESGKERQQRLEKELITLRDEKEKAKQHLALCKEEHKRHVAAFEESKTIDIKLEEESRVLFKVREEKQKERFTFLEKARLLALQHHECKNQEAVLDKEFLLSEKKIQEQEEIESTLTVAVEEKRNIVQKLVEEITALRKRIEKNKELLREGVKEKEHQEKALQKITQQLQEMQAKQKAWLHLEETQAGFSEGAKLLLKASKDRHSSLYSKIQSFADFITPKEGSEISVTAALTPYLNTLIVPTKEDGALVIAYAKEKGIHHFSLFCLEQITPTKALKHSLKDLVQSTVVSEYFLSKIRLQKELQWGADTKYVTEAGYFVDENGVIFSYKTEGIESTVLVRKRELQTIQEALDHILEERESQKTIVDSLTTKVKTLIEETENWEIDLRKKEMVHVTEKLHLNAKSAEKQAAFERREKIRTRITEVHREKQQLSVRVQQSTIACELSSQEEQRLLASLEAVEKQFHHKNKEKADYRKELSEKQHAYQRAFEAEKTALSEYIVLEKSVHVKEEASQKIFLELNQNHDQQKQLVHTYEELFASVQHKNELLIREKHALEELGIQVANAKKEYIENETFLQKSASELVLLKEKKHRYDLSLAQLFSQKKILEEKNIEDRELPELSLEEIQKKIQEISSKLAKSGPVNFASIEDLQREKEIFSQLDDNLQDVLKAKQDLEKVLQVLERESKKAFLTHFSKIREEFKNTFALLFEGGEADLILTSETDLSEAGVEIHAKPPGKKMQRLSLLSGGEKCLTALALLFAFFSVTPAPFCILDEVDAPLDESNVERFTNLLKRFTEKTQFVVVTHNKKTMSTADLLVGVSMEEKGVSRLLSLVFEKDNLEVVRV